MQALVLPGLRQDHRTIDLQALEHSSAKTRKKGGWRGLRPWPLRCLSQFLSERKERKLRERLYCI